MENDINILNHVGLLVSDVHAAVARYEQLGFQFAPLSHVKVAFEAGSEPIDIGSGKQDAIFEKNFLEIAGVTEPEIWNKLNKAQRGYFDIDGALKRYQGLHILYFGTDNLEAVHKRLVTHGLSSSAIGHLNRKVETPVGEQILHAKMLHTGQVSIAQHENPEVLLQPRYMHHRNGAKLLTECIVCTPDPAELAATYARFTSHHSQQRDQLHIVDLGFSRVVVVAPDDLGKVIPGCTPPSLPFLAGFTVATENLAQTRTLLAGNTIPFQEHDGRLLIQPEHAYGCAVLFEQEGATRL
ncbi:VOC family protein [Ktedonosporobacter rubrisoli]|uniref:VOC family protein n=1 Tax=Ktedonosporobacter rubrisoli TaxID=2509675 RepID=A0A4P6JIF6_KTERU|nr:VOC family protein [Ktedonosporobacter rubrisoli]QBD74670.1 VOC family protein [Ktedonosporobacter rubrisoli]